MKLRFDSSDAPSHWRLGVLRETDVTSTERIIATMLKSLSLASLCLIALGAEIVLGSRRPFQ